MSYIFDELVLPKMAMYVEEELDRSIKKRDAGGLIFKSQQVQKAFCSFLVELASHNPSQYEEPHSQNL
jgi:hypothetical protein